MNISKFFKLSAATLAIIITGGESPYVATVENQEIATVMVTDDKVAVKGLESGTTSIAVTDKNKKTGIISVTVK